MVYLAIASTLRFIFKMIVLPHPDIIVPPSGPDPLFRYEARACPCCPSPMAQSLLTPSPSVLRTTPRKVGVSTRTYSPTSASPCRNRSAASYAHVLTLAKSEGSCYERRLRRVKGRVTRMTHCESLSILTNAPTNSVHHNRLVDNGVQALDPMASLHSFALQLPPIIEAQSTTSLVSLNCGADIDRCTGEGCIASLKECIQVPRTSGFRLEYNSLAVSHLISPCGNMDMGEGREAAITRMDDTSGHHFLNSPQLNVPSLMLTIPTPEIPSLPSFNSIRLLGERRGACMVSSSNGTRRNNLNPCAGFIATSPDSNYLGTQLAPVTDTLSITGTGRVSGLNEGLSLNAVTCANDLTGVLSLDTARTHFGNRNSPNPWSIKQVRRSVSLWRKVSTLIRLAARNAVGRRN